MGFDEEKEVKTERKKKEKRFCAGWMMLQAKLQRTIFICIRREFRL